MSAKDKQMFPPKSKKNQEKSIMIHFKPPHVSSRPRPLVQHLQRHVPPQRLLLHPTQEGDGPGGTGIGMGGGGGPGPVVPAAVQVRPGRLLAPPQPQQQEGGGAGAGGGEETLGRRTPVVAVAAAADVAAAAPVFVFAAAAAAHRLFFPELYLPSDCFSISCHPIPSLV